MVTTGALAKCTMGIAPGPLTFIPAPVVGGPVQAGKITDIIPLLNVPSFGLCTSILNPVVAAATAAALGVLVPMPCIPAPTGPWSAGSSAVFLGGVSMLDSASMLNCAYAGVITITFAGQTASTCAK